MTTTGLESRPAPLLFSKENPTGAKDAYITDVILNPYSGFGFETDSSSFNRGKFPFDYGQVSTEAKPVYVQRPQGTALKSINAISAAVFMHLMPCFRGGAETSTINVGELVFNLSQNKKAKIRVSSKLKMSMEKMRETSLLAPSGVLLSWLSTAPKDSDEQR